MKQKRQWSGNVSKIAMGVAYDGEDWKDFVKFQYPKHCRVKINSKNVSAQNLYDYLKEWKPNGRFVVINCYNTPEVWVKRNEAKSFYEEGAFICEGSEGERYGNILLSLISTKEQIVYDE